jgi:hypothetical protein
MLQQLAGATKGENSSMDDGCVHTICNYLKQADLWQIELTSYFF